MDKKREALIKKLMARDGIDRKAALKRIRDFKKAYDASASLVLIMSVFSLGLPIIEKFARETTKGIEILNKEKGEGQ